MLKIAQKALLFAPNGQVLVLKSTDPDGYGNRWDFPGGRMEEGEAPLETLKREIQEEIGLDLNVDAARLFHAGWFKGFGSCAQDDVYKNFWILNVAESTLTLSWEHAEHQWMDPKQLPNDLTGPYRAVIEASLKFL